MAVPREEDMVEMPKALTDYNMIENGQTNSSNESEPRSDRQRPYEPVEPRKPATDTRNNALAQKRCAALNSLLLVDSSETRRVSRSPPNRDDGALINDKTKRPPVGAITPNKASVLRQERSTHSNGNNDLIYDVHQGRQEGKPSGSKPVPSPGGLSGSTRPPTTKPKPPQKPKKATPFLSNGGAQPKRPSISITNMEKSASNSSSATAAPSAAPAAANANNTHASNTTGHTRKQSSKKMLDTTLNYSLYMSSSYGPGPNTGPPKSSQEYTKRGTRSSFGENSLTPKATASGGGSSPGTKRTSLDKSTSNNMAASPYSFMNGSDQSTSLTNPQRPSTTGGAPQRLPSSQRDYMFPVDTPETAELSLSGDNNNLYGQRSLYDTDKGASKYLQSFFKKPEQQRPSSASTSTSFNYGGGNTSQNNNNNNNTSNNNNNTNKGLKRENSASGSMTYDPRSTSFFNARSSLFVPNSSDPGAASAKDHQHNNKSNDSTPVMHLEKGKARHLTTKVTHPDEGDENSSEDSMVILSAPQSDNDDIDAKGDDEDSESNSENSDNDEDDSDETSSSSSSEESEKQEKGPEEKESSMEKAASFYYDSATEPTLQRTHTLFTDVFTAVVKNVVAAEGDTNAESRKSNGETHYETGDNSDPILCAPSTFNFSVALHNEAREKKALYSDDDDDDEKDDSKNKYKKEEEDDTSEEESEEEDNDDDESHEKERSVSTSDNMRAGASFFHEFRKVPMCSPRPPDNVRIPNYHRPVSTQPPEPLSPMPAAPPHLMSAPPPQPSTFGPYNDAGIYDYSQQQQPHQQQQQQWQHAATTPTSMMNRGSPGTDSTSTGTPRSGLSPRNHVPLRVRYMFPQPNINGPRLRPLPKLNPRYIFGCDYLATAPWVLSPLMEDIHAEQEGNQHQIKAGQRRSAGTHRPQNQEDQQDHHQDGDRNKKKGNVRRFFMRKM